MKKKLTAGIILLFFFHVSAVVLFAQTVTPTDVVTPTGKATPTPDTKSKDLENVKNKIKELENTVNKLQSEEKTLKSQIDVMDNQIQLTELRIDATEQEITELTKSIGIASKKIHNLEGSLESITKVLLNRIVASYKLGSTLPAQVIVSSKNFEDYYNRSSYIKIAQMNDKRLLYDTQQARNDYANQKNIFEDQKKQVVLLQNQLEEYTKQIASEKKSKSDLLEVTQNDEKKYQALLASAKAERSAIEGVISSLRLENGTPVTKGQVIATVGNSGAPYCSTGPHLHFEVRVNGANADPNGYIRNGVNYQYSYTSEQFGYYGSLSPSGSWDWPLDEVILINQGYGSHGYARSFYPGGLHNGIDMESESSSLIKAPADGTLYRGSTTCNGVPMNYVAVDHGGGVISWYWHVR